MKCSNSQPQALSATAPLIPHAREEGRAGLYKGFAPKALRLGIGQTIGLMTFKQTLELLGAGAQRQQ